VRAGLPQAPTSYSPVRNPEAAKGRRAEVLQAMVRAHMVSPAVAARINRRGLGLHLSQYYTHRRERHFFDYVERQLRRDLGPEVVARGGLSIHTTLNMKLQRQARKAIRGRLGAPHDPAAAVVSIDARNGAIVAMATTEKYEKEQFDYASQGHRQPGSTFKPIVLLAAISGHQVDPRRTFYVSKPLNLDTGFGPVKVSTYDHTYGGRMNLVQATLRSDNTVFEQLDLDVGPDLVAGTAANMGIDTPLDGYPAEGLGGLYRGVTPLELARAYATLASGGNRLEISAIHSVEVSGGKSQILDGTSPDALFKDGETYPITRILQQNLRRGTGQAAKIGCPAAGKTGTTDDFRDAWFAGYTPRLSTVVWVGYPHRSISMLNVHGIKVAGATFPAQIWHDFMVVAKGNYCGKFPKPLEKAVLKPYCARYTATRNCEPPPGAGDEAQSPVQSVPQAPPEQTTTTTVPAVPEIPDTHIVSGPPPRTLARRASFTFDSSGAVANGFECSVDSGPFATCSSPIGLSGLAPGDHLFTVRALSPAGDADTSPAAYRWTVYSDLQPSSPQTTQTQPQPKPKQRSQSPPIIIW